MIFDFFGNNIHIDVKLQGRPYFHVTWSVLIWWSECQLKLIPNIFNSPLEIAITLKTEENKRDNGRKYRSVEKRKLILRNDFKIFNKEEVESERKNDQEKQQREPSEMLNSEKERKKCGLIQNRKLGNALYFVITFGRCCKRPDKRSCITREVEQYSKIFLFARIISN